MVASTVSIVGRGYLAFLDQIGSSCSIAQLRRMLRTRRETYGSGSELSSQWLHIQGLVVNPLTPWELSKLPVFVTIEVDVPVLASFKLVLVSHLEPSSCKATDECPVSRKMGYASTAYPLRRIGKALLVQCSSLWRTVSTELDRSESILPDRANPVDGGM